MRSLFLDLFIFVGVVQIVLGVPLMLRLVKPNALFGFRTARTLSDPRTWYDANAYAGRLMLGAGVLTLVVALGLYFVVPSLPRGVYALAAGVVTVGGALASLSQAMRYLRRLEE